MRAKSIAIFLTVVVALVSVSLFQVDRAIFNDQVLSGQGGARAQIAALIPAFQGEFRLINENFRTAAPEAFGKNADFGDAVSKRFEMLAKLKLDETGWIIEERAFHNSSGIKSWAENYTQIALKALKPRDIPLGGTALTALLDPQRRPFFLWIFRSDNDQWFGAITKSDVFQALVDRQRGQAASVFLVNNTGQVLGHTTPEYVGTLMSDDPIVAEIISTQKKQGVGLFQGGQGEVQGLYEQVPGTNVSVILARPMAPLKANREAVRLQILLMGAGLALFGLAALLLSIRDNPSRVPNWMPTTPLPPLPAVASSTPVRAGTPSSAAGATPTTDKGDLMREKMNAYVTSASALAREMHAPLIRILSQAQLLKAKAVGHEEVGRIEQLAREARGIVLKLLSFAGEEEFAPESTSVNEVLNRSLSVFEGKLQSKGIRVEKDLKRMPEITAHPLALLKIFEVLFNNAIESMERMPNKNLHLSLDTEDSKLVFRMRDSGEGVSPDKVSRVFDPFFTTKSPSQHSGLGLSTAFGLAREFGGELFFESTPGKGSLITLKFPVGVNANTPGLAPAQTAPVQAVPPKVAAASTPVSRPEPPPAPVSPAIAVRATPAAKTPAPAPVNLDLDLNLELVGEFADRQSPPTSSPDDFSNVRIGAAGSLIQEKALAETLSILDQVDRPSPLGKPVAPDVGPNFPDEFSDTGPSIALKPQPVKPPPPGPKTPGGNKIDKPQIQIKKNLNSAGRMASTEVAIRRPGERK